MTWCSSNQSPHCIHIPFGGPTLEADGGYPLSEKTAMLLRLDKKGRAIHIHLGGTIRLYYIPSMIATEN
jgi:hypothetical protein